MIPPPILCACGAEIIPGPLWSPALAAAWQEAHGSHGAPAERPRSIGGILPVHEARALRAELRDRYVVGLVEHGDGTASVLVRTRGTTSAR